MVDDFLDVFRGVVTGSVVKEVNDVQCNFEEPNCSQSVFVISV